MYEGLHKYELYELGWAIAAGFNKPEELRKLLPAREVKIPTTGPLAIPKKKVAN